MAPSGPDRQSVCRLREQPDLGLVGSPMGQHRLVSVVIPTYNRADLVCESLDSVLSQDYPNFEMIVVDDGSTDDTREVIRARFGDTVRYIHQHNAGPAAARNTGIRAARGEYIAFQDDDDLWLPGKLARQVEALERRPDHGFCYGQALAADPDGNSTGRTYGASDKGKTGDNFAVMVRHHAILGPSLVIRRKCLATVGLFDESFLTAEDTELFLRLTLEWPGVYVHDPLVLVREHAGRKTSAELPDGRVLRAVRRAYEKLLQELGPDRERHRALAHWGLVSTKLKLAGVTDELGDGQATMDLIPGLLSEHWEALSAFDTFQELAKLPGTTPREGERYAAQIAAVEGMLADLRMRRDVPRGYRGLLYCAAARRCFASGCAGGGVYWARRALAASPVAFARHLAPKILQSVPQSWRRVRQAIAPNQACCDDRAHTR